MRKLAGSCWQLAVSKINETERLLRKTKSRVEAPTMTPLFLSLRAEGEAISQVGWNSYSVVFTLNELRFTNFILLTSQFIREYGVHSPCECFSHCHCEPARGRRGSRRREQPTEANNLIGKVYYSVIFTINASRFTLNENVFWIFCSNPGIICG